MIITAKNKKYKIRTSRWGANQHHYYINNHMERVNGPHTIGFGFMRFWYSASAPLAVEMKIIRLNGDVLCDAQEPA